MIEITGELKQNEEIKNMLNDISKENELLGNELIKAFPNELELKENEYFYKNKKGEWCIWKNPDTNAKVVAIWKPEKTADELFQELGYEIKKSTTVHRYRLYNADDILAIHISFNLKTKRINIVCEKEALDMQELKAINKKVEELGWKLER
jgi:hypothetical protein